jgi:transcriptional regulator with XRE-family HTH domain
LKNSQEDISQRLKEVRLMYSISPKLSVNEFANAIEESPFNIANYENGKANVTNRVLVKLYRIGFNPTYILTGEGSPFADNDEGRKIALKNGIKYSIISDTDIRMVAESDPPVYDDKIELLYGMGNFSGKSLDQLITEAAKHTAAAGDIMEYVKRRNKK